MIAMPLAVLISLILLSSVALKAQIALPEGPFTLRRIDIESGKELWHVKFSRVWRPYQCDVFQRRVVVALRLDKIYRDADQTDKDELETSIEQYSEVKTVFLNSLNGKRTPSFDVQEYIDRECGDTNFIHSSWGWRMPNRSEFTLENGWYSYDAMRPGTKAHFFNGDELKWTLNLPVLSDHLTGWKELLIFHQANRQKREEISFRWVGHLFGQTIGSSSPSWDFSLPQDIRDDTNSNTFAPDVDFAPGTFFSRNFSFVVGTQEIYVFANETVLALNPATGKVNWESPIPIVGKLPAGALDFGEIFDSKSNLVLASGRILAKLDKATRTRLTVLRTDLSFDQLVVVGESIYCFTYPRKEESY